MADVLTSTYNPSTVADSIFEDVEGVIQNISPYKTPYIASIGSGRAKQTNPEWPEDELKTPTGSNKAVEGADAESTSRTVPVRLGNYTQIMEDTFLISGTLDASDTIGRASESKYQLKKSLKYLNTELEYSAINSASAVAGNASTERELKGMEGFITTNDESFASQATTNLFTEDILMDMSEGIFNNSDADSQNLLVGGSTAKQIAGWDQNSRITVNTNAAEKTIVMVVLVLETPFGRIRVVIDRYIAVTSGTGGTYTSAYLYDPDKAEISWLRNWKTTKLGKSGDADKYQTVGEMTLKLYSEKAAAKCGDILAKAS